MKQLASHVRKGREKPFPLDLLSRICWRGSTAEPPRAKRIAGSCYAAYALPGGLHLAAGNLILHSRLPVFEKFPTGWALCSKAMARRRCRTCMQYHAPPLALINRRMTGGKRPPCLAGGRGSSIWDKDTLSRAAGHLVCYAMPRRGGCVQPGHASIFNHQGGADTYARKKPPRNKPPVCQRGPAPQIPRQAAGHGRRVRHLPWQAGADSLRGTI